MPPASSGALPSSSNFHVRMTSKRARSPHLHPELSRRIRSHENSDMGDATHHRLLVGDNASIPVSCRQGWIPPAGPLPVLPNSNLWF